MNYFLIITNELNGQTEVVTRLFSSVEEAQQYVDENHLILQRIISEQEYHMMLQNNRNQKLMRQYYQRPPPQQQVQQQQNVMHEEPEEPELLPQPKPRKPVFVIVNPLKINPKFVTVNRRKK